MPFRVERDRLIWRGRARTDEPAVGDGDEVRRRAKTPRGALGLLQQAVHVLDEGIRSVVGHAAHDRVGAFGDRQVTSRSLQPAKQGSTLRTK